MALNASLVLQGLVDRLYLYLAPIIIGGDQAPGFVRGSGFGKLEDALKIDEIEIKKIGSDILLTGRQMGSGLNRNK